VIGGTLIALVGAVVLRLTFSDEYLRFVKDTMRPWLLVAGFALALLGAVTVVRALRGPDEHAEHAEPREGWLILAPIAALLLIAPPALGSYGVDRSAPVRITSHSGEFPPLRLGHGPVPMTLLEYGQRAFDGDGRTLKGASVELTGFVVDSTAGSFRLARYQIACCAADAAAAVVRVVGIAGAAPPQDDWVTVTGSYHAPDGETPVLSATAVEPIAPPADPYE